MSLRSLGRHRLKDFDEPVELFQACHDGLVSEFAPLRTRDAVIDVPVPRTSFIGRRRELAHVVELLNTNRLVTLSGVGGTGKTRLALEAAVADAERHSDGVFFVDLAPLSDPALVLSRLPGPPSPVGPPGRP